MDVEFFKVGSAPVEFKRRAQARRCSTSSGATKFVPIRTAKGVNWDSASIVRDRRRVPCRDTSRTPR
jgi:hypothetical protein